MKDYEERFAAEYYQLKDRARKLEDMLRRWEAGELGFEPKCPKALLYRQLAFMAGYLGALEERAAVEGVGL